MYGSFLLFVVLPIVVLGFVSYQNYKSVIIEQSTQRTLQTLKQVGVGIDREAVQIINTGNVLYKDAELLSVVNGYHESGDAAEKAKYLQKVQSIVTNDFQYTDDLISVIFFYRSGGTLSIDPNLQYDEKLLRNSLWYNKTLAAEGKIKLFGVQPNFLLHSSEKYINTAAIAIPNAQQSGVEVIYFIYKGTLFQNLFEANTKEYGAFLILDTEDRAIAANRETYIQSWLDRPAYLNKTGISDSGEYIERIDGEPAYITFFRAPETRFKVIHIVPYSVLTAPLNKIFVRTVVVGAVVMGLFFVTIWLFSRTITGPIRALVQEMFKVKKGQLPLDFEPDGPSEVYRLGSRFKVMMGEMDDLIREREEQERSRSLAELQALQSQINPHFLLNTLNAIKLMAILSKVPNIRDMTDAFIRLLSSSFNRGGMLHSVKEEMEYLQKYFDIMEYRYGNYKVIWDIDPQMHERYMLKLLLQPIVENAIIHGLQHKEREGELRLRGRIVDGNMLFTIQDDGAGIAPDELEELLQPKPEFRFSGMGMRNVHQRIVLHYGQSCGLRITSHEGLGTTVEVVLPELTEPDAAEYEQERRHIR